MVMMKLHRPIKPAAPRRPREITATRARRRVNACVIIVSTALAVQAMVTISPETMSVFEPIGIAAAVLASTFTSLWHLTAAGRSTRPGFVLCGLLTVAGLGTALCTYMMGHAPRTILGAPDVSRELQWMQIATFVITVSALPLAIHIAAIGLRLTGVKR